MIHTREIITDVESRTGLKVTLDEGTIERLNRYVDALNGEASLNPRGEAGLQALLETNLENRVKVDNYLDQHPELLDRPVEKPLFVFGLPRTGTTHTINLLHADPARRSLLRWEAMNSVPPPKAGELSTDPRCVQEQAMIDMVVERDPVGAAIHYEAADSPTECQLIMSQAFLSQVFEALAEVPRYRDWFMSADYLPAFYYHKRLLQLLQAEAPGRWTLKNPWHALFLEDLTTVYPDAQLVMTHRDPVEVMGSTCSMINHVRSRFSDQIDKGYIRESMLDTFETMINRALAFKQKHGWDSIYDLQYANLMSDPIGEMKKLYRHFDEPWSPAVESSMHKLLDKNPKHRFGKHEYTLEEYGLNEQMIRARFDVYYQRFNIC